MDEIPIADITVGTRHRKELGDIPALMESLQDVGMIQPIALKPNHDLIAGARRLEAARRLGWLTVPFVVVENLDDAIKLLKAERDENICREDFAPSEAVAIGKDIADLERPAAAERQIEGGRIGGKTAGVSRPKKQSEKASGNFPEAFPETSSPSSNGQTRDKVGAAVGMSGKTFAAAQYVVDHGMPEDVQEMDRTNKINPVFKRVKARVSSNGKGRVPTGAANGEATDWGAVLRWATKRNHFTTQDVVEKFGVSPKSVYQRLSSMVTSRGYLVKKLGDGDYQVLRAVHFPLLDGQEDFKAVMKKLLDAARFGYSINSSNTSSRWPLIDQQRFLMEFITVAEAFSKG